MLIYDVMIQQSTEIHILGLKKKQQQQQKKQRKLCQNSGLQLL